MNPFACAYIFVKFTYLIQLNFVVQILVFQGIGAFLFSIKNYNLFEKKKKIIDLFTICITCALVKIFYQDSAKQ